MPQPTRCPACRCSSRPLFGTKDLSMLKRIKEHPRLSCGLILAPFSAVMVCAMSWWGLRDFSMWTWGLAVASLCGLFSAGAGLFILEHLPAPVRRHPVTFAVCWLIPTCFCSVAASLIILFTVAWWGSPYARQVWRHVEVQLDKLNKYVQQPPETAR